MQTIHCYTYSFCRNNFVLANKFINKDIECLISLSTSHNLTVNPNQSASMIFGKNYNSMALNVAQVEEQEEKEIHRIMTLK